MFSRPLLLHSKRIHMPLSRLASHPHPHPISLLITRLPYTTATAAATTTKPAIKINSDQQSVPPYRPTPTPTPTPPYPSPTWAADNNNNQQTEYPVVARRALDNRKHVVVLGTGWGGYQFLRAIDRTKYRVTCVAPRNHFLFTPLLASTTVGTLEYRAIIEPVREIDHLDYFASYVEKVESGKQQVLCRDVFDGRPFALEYDELVIAVGCKSNTFNVPGVHEYAFFLKNIQDARKIRNRILECFEKAIHPLTNEEEKQRLTTFVVVGGGPTSVEFSGELYDFIRRDVARKFPRVPSRTILIEATDHLLSSFDHRLSSYVESTFQKRHITVMTKTQVKAVCPSQVVLSDGRVIPCGMVVWSTGLAPNELISSLPWPKQPRSGRLLVDDHLRVISKMSTPPAPVPPLPYSKTPEASPSEALPPDTEVMEHVYAIGDCATPINKNLPATAQVATSEARYLAERFNEQTNPMVNTPAPPFVYKSLGMLAYIGGYRALADLESFKGTGIGAWLFWRSAYLTRLLSVKNMILVPMYWFKSAVFGRDISRF